MGRMTRVWPERLCEGIETKRVWMAREYFDQAGRRMKYNLSRFPGPPGASQIQESAPVAENPADRELSRLRGLSAEVGAACTAWLANRGIKTRPWGQYPPNGLALKQTRLGFAAKRDE